MSINTIKTTFLLTLLSLILIFLGRLVGGPGGMIVGLGLAILMNFFSYWFSDKIVLMIYRAKEVSESESPKLYRIVRTLAEKANLPMPRVYMIPNPTPNAFATGRNPKHAAVAVTQGIMRILSDEELEGVLAHEMAHVKNRDILISSIVATIAAAISVLAYMARYAAILGTRSSRDREGSGNPIFLLVMVIITPIMATLIQLAISRAREYQADEGGSRISGKPLALASALEALHRGVEINPMESNTSTASTAHMFIVNPLSARGMFAMLSTHPPVEKRIERLKEIAKRPLFI